MENIPEELKNLNIIIGQEPYDDYNIICKTDDLKKENCKKFYQDFTTVAFVLHNSKKFKHSFENIINLLYYNQNINIRNKYNEITKDTNWIKFVDNLYTQNKIVLINANELEDTNIKTNHILNNANALLMCGYKSKQKVESILGSKHKSKSFYAIHPSPRTNGNIRYTENWICIKTKGNFLSTNNKCYKHSHKNPFMI